MITTSPSALQREMKCLASAVLPTAGSESGPQAVRGDLIHAFMALRAEKGHEVARATLSPDLQDFVDQVEFEKLPVLDITTGVAELALAWNPKTGKVRELARGGKLTREQIRALAEPGEMVGIIDWLALTDAAVVVFDWKTGRGQVEAANTNVQIGTYAFMAARLFGREEAVVAIGRLLETGTWVDQAYLDGLDLDALERRVRAHLHKVAQLRAEGVARPTPFEGTHCTYCPSFKFCPAKTALALSVLSDGEKSPAMFAYEALPLDAEAVAELWPKVLQAEALLEKMKAQLSDYATHHLVKLANGMVLAAVEKERETIDAVAAEQHLDPGVYGEAVETKLTMTKVALKKALQKRLQQGQKISQVEKATLERLRAAGAVKVNKWVTVEEVKPKALEATVGDGGGYDEWADPAAH